MQDFDQRFSAGATSGPLRREGVTPHASTPLQPMLSEPNIFDALPPLYKVIYKRFEYHLLYCHEASSKTGSGIRILYLLTGPILTTLSSPGSAVTSQCMCMCANLAAVRTGR